MQVAFPPTKIAVIVCSQRITGSTDATIRDIASLKHARAGDLSFLGNPKYRAEVAETSASLVLVPLDFAGTPKENQQFVFVENPSGALARLCARIEHSLW